MKPFAAPLSLGRCGLVCSFCKPPEECSCGGNNHCGKRLSPQGCYQYTCSKKRGFAGCWECPDAPCGKDMHAKEHVKIRAFIRCMKEDGLDAFSGYLARNAGKGVVYHRAGILGDYDLATEEEALRLLRGK